MNINVRGDFLLGNQACDLNSIPVLPPHTRRSSLLPPKSQPQPRSQLPQQNAMFSQTPRKSFDEVLTGNQGFNLQEKDNSVKRLSCLAPSSYPRDESQLPISRSSANLTRKWRFSGGQLNNEEVEHKFATMETLVSRLGMILDSVQSDVMQVNKGTKELSLAVEGIRQKLIAQNDSLHLLNRGQEEMKTSLDVGLRSVSNQLSNMSQKDQMQEIMSTVMTFPNQIQTIVHKQVEELSKLLSEDLQAIFCNLNTLNQKHLPLDILPPKVTGGDSSQQKPLFRSEPQPTTVFTHAQFVPKPELGGWKTVKPDRPTQSNRQGNSSRNMKQRRFSPLARPRKVVVSLDDDSDDDFSCIIGVVEKELDNFLLDEEAEQILKKARRRKRKQNCKRVS